MADHLKNARAAEKAMTRAADKVFEARLKLLPILAAYCATEMRGLMHEGDSNPLIDEAITLLYQVESLEEELILSRVKEDEAVAKRDKAWGKVRT
jgi:hypothetical protein